MSLKNIEEYRLLRKQMDLLILERTELGDFDTRHDSIEKLRDFHCQLDEIADELKDFRQDINAETLECYRVHVENMRAGYVKSKARALAAEASVSPTVLMDFLSEKR